MSAALRSVGRLDVLSSTPAAPSGRAPCIHARLHRLATKSASKIAWDRGRPAQCRIVFAVRGTEQSEMNLDVDLDMDLDLDVDRIRRAPLSHSNSIICSATASTSTSNSRSRSKSRSQNRDSHAKMEFLKNYAALGVPPASLMEMQAHARETRALPGRRPRNPFSCVTGCAPARGRLAR